MNGIKDRNPILVLILSIITFGIYSLYWFIVTKDEINDLGASIPTAILIIIPIANIYFIYKYAEGFTKYVEKEDSTLLWFLLLWVIGIIGMPLVQIKLNKLAHGS